LTFKKKVIDSPFSLIGKVHENMYLARTIKAFG